MTLAPDRPAEHPRPPKGVVIERIPNDLYDDRESPGYEDGPDLYSDAETRAARDAAPREKDGA